ncbi:MAG: hypothetical protein MRJ67_03945 [Nitrospirales bacterium]|nr:hypothetical protein [Nitrospirales bacterium]
MIPDNGFRRYFSRLFSQSSVYLLIGLLLFKGIQGGYAKAGPLKTDPSQSPLTQLQNLPAEGSQNSSDPAMLLQLADLYLEIGQEIYQDESWKRQVFDEGARLARQGLDREQDNADAHDL